jgi:hypothetical protein
MINNYLDLKQLSLHYLLKFTIMDITKHNKRTNKYYLTYLLRYQIKTKLPNPSMVIVYPIEILVDQPFVILVIHKY